MNSHHPSKENLKFLSGAHSTAILFWHGNSICVPFRFMVTGISFCEVNLPYECIFYLEIFIRIVIRTVEII